MIPKRYDKFGTVKILTVSRKQWYKNFENPSKFIFIVHPLVYELCIVHEHDNLVSHLQLDSIHIRSIRAFKNSRFHFKTFEFDKR